ASVVAATALTGDASSRRYVRLALRGGDAPATAVAMLIGTERRFGPGADEFAGPIADRELPFVNVARWLATRGFAVPAIYRDAAAADRLLLLEDVGDTSLWAAASARPDDAPALFAAAVELLAPLPGPGLRPPAPGGGAFRQRLAAPPARGELEHCGEHGIDPRHGTSLPPTVRRSLLEALDPLAAPFADDERVLVHRDFMAWNIHVKD